VSGPAVRPTPAAEGPLGRLGWLARDSVVLMRRSVTRIARDPSQLMDVTVQPIMFILLFAYVFGGSILLPGGGSYHAYLVSGMFGMTMAGTAPGTAVALTTDMSSGLIDRFRSLPMSQSAVLAGRALADLATQFLGLLVIAGAGLIVGWRVDTGWVQAVSALGILLLFAFAMGWLGAVLGMLLPSPESAQATGFLLFFPMSFISNAFVSTQGTPGWLAAVANWNPISAVSAATRQLLGNPNPSARVPVWPMQHPALAAALWSALLVAVFAPLAVSLYRRRTLRA
jgi:ABC-2 type transport system permease protein